MRTLSAQEQYRPERLRLIADVFGLTQKELGERLGISQEFVSQILNSVRPFPQRIALCASAEFQLPLSFFGVAPNGFESFVPTFRKNSGTKRADERRASALLREANRTWSETSRRSGYRAFPSELSGMADGDLDQAARKLRALVGLNSIEPVPNMTRLAERLGVGVINRLGGFSDSTDHDGASLPSRKNERPLIALLNSSDGARSRFTIAHELGHLVYDQDLEFAIRSTRAMEERRAHAFAGALLLPREVVTSRVTHESSLTDMLCIKSEYGISVAATIMRAKAVKAISPERARSLQIQLSNRGWRKSEPVAVRQELPLLFGQAARRAFGERSTVFQMSEELGVSPHWIRQWLNEDGEMAGGGQGSIISLDSRRRRATDSD